MTATLLPGCACTTRSPSPLGCHRGSRGRGFWTPKRTVRASRCRSVDRPHRAIPARRQRLGPPNAADESAVAEVICLEGIGALHIRAAEAFPPSPSADAAGCSPSLAVTAVARLILTWRFWSQPSCRDRLATQHLLSLVVAEARRESGARWRKPAVPFGRF
jgi:hypothetical protein